MTTRPRTLNVREEMRLFAGLVVQPVVAALAGSIGFPLFLLDRDGRTPSGGVPTDLTQAAISIGLSAGIVAFFVTIACAWPMALWMIKRKRVSLSETLMSGLILGNLPFFLLAVPLGTYGVEGLLRGAAFASMLGLAGAATFWSIVIRGRDFSQEPASR